MRFSPSENAFYPTELTEQYEQANSLPSDLIDVDDAIFIEFVSVPPDGKIRGVGSDGMPIWLDMPPLAHDELVAAAERKKTELRSAADAEISWRTDAVSEGMATEQEAALLTEWRKYRVLLMRIDTSAVPDIEWPTPPVE
ncbi:tail fiber assembly protein [Escherichia coli]|uniref:tail fiber assembly protein n=1 Tax=Escherichia coli TaxID=562 RepID=UPI00351C51C0|nr:tail fiber assembly protein [Escherichia coli]